MKKALMTSGAIYIDTHPTQTHTHIYIYIYIYNTWNRPDTIIIFIITAGCKWSKRILRKVYSKKIPYTYIIHVHVCLYIMRKADRKGET